MKFQFLPVLFAALTALFWGMYGPVIGLARTAEGGGPSAAFKPYVLIGVAYLIWAILGGIIGIKANGAALEFTSGGLKWGFIGGSLGAFGALTLTLAMFSFVGKPHPEVVMPIVFGGAVCITALTNMFLIRSGGGHLEVKPMLWVGMIGMAICIVIVAANTPHPHPPKKPAAPAPEKAPEAAAAPEASNESSK